MVYVVEQDFVADSRHGGGAGGGVGCLCKAGVIDAGIRPQVRKEDYSRLPAVRIVTVDFGVPLHTLLIHIDEANGPSGVIVEPDLLTCSRVVGAMPDFPDATCFIVETEGSRDRAVRIVVLHLADSPVLTEAHQAEALRRLPGLCGQIPFGSFGAQGFDTAEDIPIGEVRHATSRIAGN